MQIDIVELKKDHIPVYKHDMDACADCKASLNEDVIIAPGGMCTIPLGFKICIPEGYEGQIRPRSGLARNNGVIAVIGCVDPGYTGEVCVTLHNCLDIPFTVHDGDRVCQLKLEESLKMFFRPVDRLPDSERSEAGFGSTGI